MLDRKYTNFYKPIRSTNQLAAAASGGCAPPTQQRQQRLRTEEWAYCVISHQQRATNLLSSSKTPGNGFEYFKV